MPLMRGSSRCRSTRACAAAGSPSGAFTKPTLPGRSFSAASGSAVACSNGSAGTPWPSRPSRSRPNSAVSPAMVVQAGWKRVDRSTSVPTPASAERRCCAAGSVQAWAWMSMIMVGSLSVGSLSRGRVDSTLEAHTGVRVKSRGWPGAGERAGPTHGLHATHDPLLTRPGAWSSPSGGPTGCGISRRPGDPHPTLLGAGLTVEDSRPAPPLLLREQPPRRLPRARRAGPPRHRGPRPAGGPAVPGAGLADGPPGLSRAPRPAVRGHRHGAVLTRVGRRLRPAPSARRRGARGRPTRRARPP